MKFYIETIGCQQNEYDASRLSVFLKKNGFEEVSIDQTDVVFILACSVRKSAVDRVLGRVKNWSKDKKVIVTSCLTQDEQDYIENRESKYWRFGDIKQLEKILNKKFYKNKISNLSETNYIPIMSGCDNFCSYCIVPYTRGRETSRPIAEIISEAKNLISRFNTSNFDGSREIILLGQNVNSYKYGFGKLLEKINNLPGDFMVSFISNHPKDMNNGLIEIIAHLPKVKKEIHLPLQSGSDKILKLMNRPYTAAKYLRLVENLKSKVKNLKLTTDIIVGFPGETEIDFQKTVEICKKVGYSLAYINKYSPRKGTAAYKLGDPISWEEKQRRWKILNNLIN